MQIAVARATNAAMSTERANDRLITMHAATFLAIAPNQNATLKFDLCSIDPQCQDDCRSLWVCFLEKKRKRNVVWEFAKMFETMVGVELLEGYKRLVCDTCRYSNFW